MREIGLATLDQQAVDRATAQRQFDVAAGVDSQFIRGADALAAMAGASYWRIPSIVEWSGITATAATVTVELVPQTTLKTWSERSEELASHLGVRNVRCAQSDDLLPLRRITVSLLLTDPLKGHRVAAWEEESSAPPVDAGDIWS